MANLSDFFPAAGGGGGAIPKYQEFTTSGTFTPTQALIDAGGRIGLFIVGAGQSGSGDTGATGGSGGEVKMVYITLTNTNSISVTIGAPSGGSTTFAASSAGGVDVIAAGGSGGGRISGPYSNYSRQGAGFGGSGYRGGAGSGVLGYGAGGSGYVTTGVRTPVANSGSGGGVPGAAGGSGFVRVTWFE